MTKHQLLQIIIDSPDINRQLNKLQPADLRDDMRQHLYLQLLEKDTAELLRIHNDCKDCLERYTSKIIANLFKTNTNLFYRQYRRQIDPNSLQQHLETEMITDTPYQPETGKINIQKVMGYLRHQHPKKVKLFTEYFLNEKTYKQISQEYSIPYKTVWKIVNETLADIQETVRFKREL